MFCENSESASDNKNNNHKQGKKHFFEGFKLRNKQKSDSVVAEAGREQDLQRRWSEAPHSVSAQN